jgi:flagellar basal-body rod modification protein FlgD
MASSVSSVSNTTSSNVFSTASGTKSASGQQIDFLNMLMVQLKNQNPTEPYDNQQFAAQLATFSQLEQLTDIKTLLNDQADVFGLMAMSMENTALPGMIGKYASAASDTLNFDGTNPCEISYDVALSGNQSGKAIITDSSGKVVKEIELSASQINVGSHTIQWDGKNTNGDKMLTGNYTLKVELVDDTGASVEADTYTVGKIEAVRFKSSGTVIVVNGNEVALSDISDVRENAF